jgi:crossover junction endodeoxyribonuclease RuvC
VHVPAKFGMPECLAEIFRAITAALDAHPVDHVALEQTIYVQNFQTAQILGAARGAAIAAAAVRGLPVFEYPPLRVKQAVVGVGRASKEQVARTVMSLLGHGRALESDQADAAGVALCHAFTWRG